MQSVAAFPAAGLQKGGFCRSGAPEWQGTPVRRHTSPTSCRHVSNKDDLFEPLLDRVYAEVEPVLVRLDGIDVTNRTAVHNGLVSCMVI